MPRNQSSEPIKRRPRPISLFGATMAGLLSDSLKLLAHLGTGLVAKRAFLFEGFRDDGVETTRDGWVQSRFRTGVS